MTEEITSRQTAEQTTGAVPSQQQGITGVPTSRDEIEIRTPEINPYLYETLVSNVESQIEHWHRKAARQPNPETAQALRNKAEGLGYALRLLGAFEPEFRELSHSLRR